MESNRKQSADDADRSPEIGELISDLSREDFAVRTHAIRHLVSLGHAASTALVGALEADDVAVRWQAALALRGIADPATVPALLDALEDDDIGVRWVAAEALGEIGAPALGPLLHRVIHRADSARFREGAADVLLDLADGSLQPIVRPVLDALLEHGDADLSAPLAAYRALEAARRRGVEIHASPASDS